MKAKEAITKLLAALPDDVTIEDVQYHLYVLQTIRAGEKDIEEGRTVPHEEVMKSLAK